MQLVNSANLHVKFNWTREIWMALSPPPRVNPLIAAIPLELNDFTLKSNHSVSHRLECGKLSVAAFAHSAWKKENSLHASVFD